MTTMETKPAAKRILVECKVSAHRMDGTLPDGVGPGGCGLLWLTAEKAPARCPHCNGWSVELRGRLRLNFRRNVQVHECNAACRLSDSMKCACSCGGANHGSGLYEHRHPTNV